MLLLIMACVMPYWPYKFQTSAPARAQTIWHLGVDANNVVLTHAKIQGL
jgi:hypothetical protein